MKKIWLAAALAAAVLCGGAAEAAQPGLTDHPAQIETEAPQVLADCEAKLPVWKGGTALQRARVNAAVEAEAARFAARLTDLRTHGEVSGWLSWQAGRADAELVSLVLYESVYFKGAAHPSTTVVGLTFDAKGEPVARKEALARAVPQTAEDINAAIERQGKERDLMLFRPEWRTVQGWPQEFYVGADGRLYFIFQQYDIAPYAAGWIAIDAGPWTS